MRDKLIEMLWELNDHVYPDYDAKADEILSLFGVSKSFTEEQMDKAYDKGFEDGFNKMYDNVC